MIKKTMLLLTISLFVNCISAQDAQLIPDLRKALNEEKYDMIITQHSDKVEDYPAKAVYWIGMAYYMKADDQKVLEMMDLSIEKDNTDPDAYYIKATTLNYLGKFDKAIPLFEKSIELDNTNANYFSGIGDAYLSLKKYEEALPFYIEATKKEEPIERPFAMIPQIYSELNQPKKALEAFYASKKMISKESNSYQNALYNIGLYEFLNKNYDNAATSLEELIDLNPNDFQAHTKLIQVYYGDKKYQKAAPLREKLYQAYDKGLLKAPIQKMFCFDQFPWNEKLIMVYERFAEKEGELYYKHIFYITNAEGDTEFTIQTENSPISQEMGGPKYVIGMNKGNSHATFPYGFEENFEYEKLKEVVLRILEKEIKPSASSKRGKK